MRGIKQQPCRPTEMWDAGGVSAES